MKRDSRRTRGKVLQIDKCDSTYDELEAEGLNEDDESVNYVFATNPDTEKEKVTCTVGGVKLGWIVDSGAGVNVISESAWEYLKSHKVKVEQQTREVAKRLLTYGNHRLTVKGMFTAKITTKKTSICD